MSAVIRRFPPSGDRLRQDQNRQARDALVSVRGLHIPDPAVRRVLDRAIVEAVHVIDRSTSTRGTRRFVMIYPEQNRAVVEWLSLHSKWPKAAPRLWAWLWEFTSVETGEILVTREGLIDRVGSSARAVDGILAELVQLGALIKLREPEPGKQGRGTVRYFLNPNVGTSLPAGERDAAQRSAPPLKIVAPSADT